MGQTKLQRDRELKARRNGRVEGFAWGAVFATLLIGGVAYLSGAEFLEPDPDTVPSASRLYVGLPRA